VIYEAVGSVPDELLVDPNRADPGASELAEIRHRYVSYLQTRLEAPRVFATEAEEARKRVAAAAPQRQEARR
jgi:hypothetical protein